MKWYEAYYDEDKGLGVHRFAHGYNRKDVFSIAQRVANELGVTVTISAEWGTGHGLAHEYYKIEKETIPMKDAYDYGACSIWLKGSRRTIKRNVHGKHNTYYIRFGGQWIEVVPTDESARWVTKELY